MIGGVQKIPLARRLYLPFLRLTPPWLRWLWTPLCIWHGYCLRCSDGRCAICRARLTPYDSSGIVEP